MPPETTTLPMSTITKARDRCNSQDSSGQLLDFGSRVNDDNEKSYLYYPNLTQEQKDNRLMLVTAMIGAGLASCMTEWWHFSYGDQLWAWFYGKENSLYSPIDL